MKSRFNRVKKIGSGTYAHVYTVTDTTNGETVALKKLKNSDETEGVKLSTIRELSILKLSKHPNIVEMLWYDNEKFKGFTMNNYDYDLKKYMNKTCEPLSVQFIRDISYQLLKGVQYLHAHGIAHRDLKPQNILINNSSEPTIVITDMGLGRQLDIANRKCPKSHEVCTLWYRSPDILLGYKHYNFELDVWSIGCIIGELMNKSNRPLFAGDSELDQMYKIFQVFGTPNNETWEGVSELPDYKVSFPSWTNTFDTKYSSNDYDSDLLNLIKSMLIMNPLARPSIKKVLSHPFFKNVSEYVFNLYKLYKNKQYNDYDDCWLDNMTKWKMPELHTNLIDQIEITKPTKRIILLEWLLSINKHFHLLDSTYIRTQNIIDQYMMMRKDMTNKNYQLLGIAALLIASKIEETFPPEANDFIYMSSNAYTNEDLLMMEKDVLRTLDMDFYFPTSIMFVSTYANQINLSNDQIDEVKFILKYITLCLDLMKYHPSILCLCACLYVSNQTDLVEPCVNNDSNNLDEHNNESDDILECMNMMNKWLKNGIEKNIENNKHGVISALRGKTWKSKYLPE